MTLASPPGIKPWSLRSVGDVLRDGSSAAWSLGALFGSEEVLVGERGNQEAATGARGPSTWSLVQASGRGSHPPRIHRRTNRRMVACHGQVRPWATSGWRRSQSLPVGFGPQARRYGLGSKRPFSCMAGVGLPAIGAESCRAERQSCPRRDRMLGKGQRSEA